MLLKLAHSTPIITDIKKIDFNKSFSYRTESMIVEYNHLEKVFHISRRVSSSYSEVVIGNLDVSSDENQKKLLECVEKDDLLALAESKNVRKHFNVNKECILKSYVDNLKPEERDTLLFHLLFELQNKK